MSLASQLDDLLNPAPREFQPDDELDPLTAAQAGTGKNKSTTATDDGTEFDERLLAPAGRLPMKGETGDDELDPDRTGGKYAGRRTSRKKLKKSLRADRAGDEDAEELGGAERDDSNDDIGSGVDSDDDGSDDDDSDGGRSSDGGEDAGGSADDDDGSEVADDDSGSDDEDEDEEEDEDEAGSEGDGDDSIQLMRGARGAGGEEDANAAADGGNPAEKAAHVCTQRRFCDSFLQLRIRLHAGLVAAGRTPLPAARRTLEAATTTDPARSNKRQKLLAAGTDGEAVVGLAAGFEAAAGAGAGRHNMDYPPKNMALITSDYVIMCSLRIKWP